MPVISPKAIVENPAGLAADVEVGAFSYVGPDVTIGPGTVLANNVTVTGRTKIGAKCRLFPGCIVGCPPVGLDGSTPRRAGAGPDCCLGDGNFVREHATIEAGLSDAGQGTLVGPNNLIMVGCQIAADAVLDGQGIFANFTHVGRGARVEQFVRTSGLTNIADFATVGAYTFTTGYAGVDRDAPPYAIVQGLPFRVRSVNAENLRRCGFDAKAIEHIKKAFRILFSDRDGRGPAPEQLARALSELGGQHVQYLVESLQRSAAGPGGRCRQPVASGGDE